MAIMLNGVQYCYFVYQLKYVSNGRVKCVSGGVCCAYQVDNGLVVAATAAP